MSTDTTTTAHELPLVAGTWTVDHATSSVNFRVRHIGLSDVRGRFNRFDATLTVGETLADTRVDATVHLASVDTNQPERDAHLREPGLLAAEQHPLMTFRSTAVRAAGGRDAYTLDGELTINGVTRPATFDVAFQGVEVFPTDGRTHAGFSAATTVDRDDYGIDFNMPLGLDRFALGRRIPVELDLQFVAPEPSELRGG